MKHTVPLKHFQLKGGGLETSNVSIWKRDDVELALFNELQHRLVTLVSNWKQLEQWKADS